MADEFAGSLALLQASVEAHIPLALERVAANVAADAQANHTFTNRTGRLERSILPSKARGSLRGGYTVEVVGARPYGSFVEDGTVRNRAYPYLRPAFDRQEGISDEVLDAELQAAANAAGW
jgi:HK97 gp10 family phage protein